MDQAAHKVVSVPLGERTYPVRIGRGLLRDLPDYLPFDLGGRTLFVLTDTNVSAPHADAVCESLEGRDARAIDRLALPPGEANKSFAGLEQVTGWMLEKGAARDSVLFAVGGGVTGDLGGLAAALVMRGIACVQVPTTLLAQVDSSVGGKTAINTPQGKNLVGVFHQPACVVCDVDTLATLPRREILAGYAEIVKYGLIDDPEFFIWLETNGPSVCALDPDAVIRAVETSCRKKADIVARDETEQGIRALLNLGHTFAHALEAAAGYDGRLLHGEAVAVGMVLAFRLSGRLGLCAENDADRVGAHLAAVGLPTRISMIFPAGEASIENLMAFMRHDKKVSMGQQTFILANGIGKARSVRNVADEDVYAVLFQSMNGG